MASVWQGDFGLRLPPGDEASLSLIRTRGEQPWFFRNFRVMRLAAFVPPWLANFQSGRGFASAPICGRRDRMAPQNTGSGSSFAPAELTTMTLSRPSGPEFSSWKPTLAGTSIHDPKTTSTLRIGTAAVRPRSAVETSISTSWKQTLPMANL
jgi:hypothetical protein